MIFTPELISKFEDRYIPEPNSGCWLWIAGCRRGYGTMRINKRSYGSHQLSWMMKTGADRVPEKMHVCHSCDVPACVNPDHLWLGTHTENIEDSMKKGRRARKPGFLHRNSIKTHCPQGHAYEGDNLVIWSGKYRKCRICQSAGHKSRMIIYRQLHGPELNERRRLSRAAIRQERKKL